MCALRVYVHTFGQLSLRVHVHLETGDCISLVDLYVTYFTCDNFLGFVFVMDLI